MSTDTYAIARVLEERETEAMRRLAARVHELRLEGISYTRIAKTLGTSPTNAAELHREHLEVLRALDALGAADAARRVQDDRYEALLGSVWIRALSGDLNAIREARQILDSITAREAKVTAMISKAGLDGQVATLIAEGATDDYIAALREMTAQ